MEAYSNYNRSLRRPRVIFRHNKGLLGPRGTSKAHHLGRRLGRQSHRGLAQQGFWFSRSCRRAGNRRLGTEGLGTERLGAKWLGTKWLRAEGLDIFVPRRDTITAIVIHSIKLRDVIFFADLGVFFYSFCSIFSQLVV